MIHILWVSNTVGMAMPRVSLYSEGRDALAVIPHTVH